MVDKIGKGLSDKALKKWEELSASESTTLDRIVQGTASKQDIQRISSLIQGYSKLAHDVFKRGIALIEKEAKTEVKQTLDKLPAHAVSTEEVTSKALERAYKEQGAALLEAVTELIIETSNDSTATVGSYMDNHFNDSDTLSKHYHQDVIRQLEKIQEREDRQGSTPSFSVQDKLEEHQRLLEQVEENTQIGDLKDGPNSPTSSDRVGNVLDPIPVSVDNIDELAQRPQNGYNNYRDYQDSWVKQWWRNLRTFVAGRVRPKSLMQELASLAGMTYIFSPRFRDWINEKISDVSNMIGIDKIKGLLKDVYNWIKTEASNILQFIVDSLEDAVDWVSDKAKEAKQAVEKGVTSASLSVQEFEVGRKLETTNTSINAAQQGLQRLYDIRDGKRPMPPKYRANQTRLADEIKAKEESISKMTAVRDQQTLEIETIQAKQEALDKNSPNASAQVTGQNTFNGITAPTIANPNSQNAANQTFATTGDPGSSRLGLSVPASMTESAMPPITIEPSAEPHVQDSPAPTESPSSNATRGGGIGRDMPDQFGYVPGISETLAIAAIIS